MFFIAFLFLVIPPVYIISVYNNYISTLSWREWLRGEHHHIWLIGEEED